ncbi:MAG: shikimate kinase [Rhodothalassiaceae bacterium]
MTRTRRFRLFSARDPDCAIVLVGLMGAGKSSIGRRLARRLGVPFVDADAEIEKAAGRSIADIFSELGEDAFRDGERRVIARLLGDEQPKVVATGGGAFLDPETRALIRRCAISVWLDADVEVLARRTARRNTRPLLEGQDHREVLARLYAERAPIYAEADLHVRSGTGPHGEVVDAVLESLEGKIKETPAE